MKTASRLARASVIVGKDGEKKLIVGPSVPVQRLEITDRSELKSGAAVAAATATKQPDGTFTAARIDFGRGDAVL
jgi:hypothetical protein